jgi:hypothetical protein
MLCTYFGLSARKLPPKRGALSSPDGADVKDDMEPNSAPGVGNGNGGDSAREERGGGLVGGVFSALLPNDSDDKKCETGCSSNIERPCQRRVSQMLVDYLHSLRIPENLPK